MGTPAGGLSHPVAMVGAEHSESGLTLLTCSSVSRWLTMPGENLPPSTYRPPIHGRRGALKESADNRRQAV
jgi:hypothetical protein